LVHSKLNVSRKLFFRLALYPFAAQIALNLDYSRADFHVDTPSVSNGRLKRDNRQVAFYKFKGR
jgi:hypothetical protein